MNISNVHRITNNQNDTRKLDVEKIRKTKQKTLLDKLLTSKEDSSFF